MKRLTLYGMGLYGLAGGFSLVMGLRSMQPTNMSGVPPTVAALMLLMPWLTLVLGLALLGMIVAMTILTKPGNARWNSTIMMLFGSLMLLLAALSYVYQMPIFSPVMFVLGGVMFGSGLGIAAWTNPYGRLRACPECGARVVVWSKRGMTYCTSCEWYFGGVPESTSIMITGDTGVGKTALTLRLAELFLSRKKRCILVAFDQPPDVMRQVVQQARGTLPHLAAAVLAADEEFTLVDSFSCIGGLESAEQYRLKHAFDLEEMYGTVKDLCERDHVNGGTVVMLDSVNQLFLHKDPSSVLKFLSECRARLISKRGALVFSLTEGVTPENVHRNAGAVVDIILEMRFVEGGSGRLRRFRMVKVRGENIFDEWVYFEVVPKEGMVFQPIERRKGAQRELGLRDWIKGPRR
jgi:archaellum biogenesis ATPase FlaH